MGIGWHIVVSSVTLSALREHWSVRELVKDAISSGAVWGLGITAFFAFHPDADLDHIQPHALVKVAVFVTFLSIFGPVRSLTKRFKKEFEL